MEAASTQLEALIQAVNDLRRRVEALEHRSGVPAATAPSLISAPELPADLSTGLLAAIGRLLLGIAGAYLLRAATEAAILPQLAGTSIGILYAGAWLGFSVRIASHNKLIIALQGLTASLIAGPLLWESTVRFHAIPPIGAAAALTLFVALGQLVAWHRDHALIAGVTALAGCGTALALIVATLDPLPFVVALLVAAAVAEYGACLDRALPLRFIIAFTADFCAFLLIYLVSRPQGLPEGYAPLPHIAVIAVPLALLGLYTASTATRTLFRRLPMTWFEVFQIVVSAGLAITAAWRIAHAQTAMGAASLAAGTLCYLFAFTRLARRPAIGRNFHVFSTFALALVSLAGWLLFDNTARAVLWIPLGLAATWLGERRNSGTLRWHGAAYLAATLAASPLVCALAAGAAYSIAVFRGQDRSWRARLAPALLAALFLWSIAALSPPGVARTALIVTVAIAIAWCGQRWNLPELTWILYPWMGVGAVKLVIEDFQQGQSASLFLSLLLYGSALLILPRLIRQAAVRQEMSRRATASRSDLS